MNSPAKAGDFGPVHGLMGPSVVAHLAALTSGLKRLFVHRLKDEFHRIVLDRPGGTTVDYRLFHAPPPTGLACTILESWAAKPREKRDGLFREIRQSLASVKPPEDSEAEPETEVHEYLLKHFG